MAGMTDDEGADPRSGSLWAHRPEGLPDGRGRPPWARKTPRTADDPYPLRMFAEDSCPFALWGPLDEPPPGVDDDAPGFLEDVLPISADLRLRLLEWARQNALSPSDYGSAELDWMGFDLSRELATALGDLYSVKFSPTNAGSHVAEIRRRAEEEPVLGWSLRLTNPGAAG